MKKPVIGLLQLKDQDRQLEAIVNRLGFDVHTYARCDQLLSAHSKHEHSLIVVNRRLTAGDIGLLKNHPELGKRSAKVPVVLCGRQSESPELGDEHLDEPYDIPKLNSLLNRYLGVHGRKKLRVALRLPTLVCSRTGTIIAETLSLGTGGALLQSPSMLAGGEVGFEVVIPLFGKQKELEIPCRPVYATPPHRDTDYQHHIGVCFVEQDETTIREIEDYICVQLLTGSECNATSFCRPIGVDIAWPAASVHLPVQGDPAVHGLRMSASRH